jgi:hypothetical protein
VVSRRFQLIAAILAALLCSTALRAAWRQDAPDEFIDAIDGPAIGYNSVPPSDPVSRLARQLQAGGKTLAYDSQTGYLPALLQTLDIPVTSQLAVYSKTSLQRRIISPQNPRAIYFNDTVMVAWPRGGFIEIAAQDARQGVVFYMMPQQPGGATLLRRSECLSCHHSYNTLGVPGLLVRSVITGSHGESMPFLGNYLVDDRSPLEERWAGWFVTGSSGRARHLGNQLPPATRDTTTIVRPKPTAVATFADALDGYLAPTSDIAAHLVFDHQARVINLLTRLGWQVRLADAQHRDVRVTAARGARELVDALLFIDEAPLPGPIVGSHAFADDFNARGPKDGKGRSLRTLDLRTRLLRYPCSYMIYTPAFDALPAPALDAVYRRLWTVLSGDENGTRYARLSPADRAAIVEILRATKAGLPEYFGRPG